ncbi:MAG: hypothetical protein ACI9MC_002318 [Kiritimatiellia bacterium]|jgi:hypothetical protein
MPEAVRTQIGSTSVYCRYVICSVTAQDPARTLAAVRDHWGVENMSRLPHFAPNLLWPEKNLKVGLRTRRLRAGWDNVCSLNVLGFR